MLYSKLGITQFATKSKGFSGKFKQEPIDFIVQEILTDGTVANLEPDPTVKELNSEYIKFTLVKRDWNQDTVLKNIASFCGVSRKRVSYAGTKDKFALTAQKISAWKIPAERLANFKTKDITIGDFKHTLTQKLERIKNVDLAFIDGNHQEKPTTYYFEEILRYANNDSVFIFDDIHWSKGIENAWEYIKAHKKTTLTIDLFFVGIVFIKSELSKENFTIRF